VTNEEFSARKWWPEFDGEFKHTVFMAKMRPLKNVFGFKNVLIRGTTQPIPSASKLLFAFGSKLMTPMKRRLNKGAN
jgi:hypothetical protein